MLTFSFYTLLAEFLEHCFIVTPTEYELQEGHVSDCIREGGGGACVAAQRLRGTAKDLPTAALPPAAAAPSEATAKPAPSRCGRDARPCNCTDTHGLT